VRREASGPVEGIAGKGLGGFKTGGIERIFRGVEILHRAHEVMDLVFPERGKAVGPLVLSLVAQGVDHLGNDQFVVEAGRVGIPVRDGLGMTNMAIAVPWARSR
jgi:hypothetical protein